MGLFHLNGNEIDTCQGKLVPGDKVDVIVSFTPLNQQLVQRVLVEKVEVESSSEPQPNGPHRQVCLLGTREQCLLLDNTPKHGTLSLVARNPEHETLQYPNGINAEAFKELEAAASVAPSELERD